MSIFGSMRTAVSGMNAQANKLSTVADNIANVNTTGYKSVSTSFSSLVLPSGGGSYNSGGVDTAVSSNVTDQGDTISTTSETNLAIQGDGFFVVQSPAGQYFLTRAGDFTPDANGNLVNSAGFTLMASSYGTGAPAVTVNGFSDLVPVNVSSEALGLTATATTAGTYSGNLNSGATVAPVGTATLPSDNLATTTADTQKSSIVGYDSLGNTVKYDMYFTKTQAADTTAGTDDQWQVTVFRADQATTGGTSSFPYLNADGTAATPLSTSTLEFSSTGQLTSGGTFTINDPLSGGSIDMDMSTIQQLASKFSGTGSMNGQGASPVTGVTIDKNGLVNATYSDSSTKTLYQIPLATVTSPDKMTLLSGNVYSANGESGVTVSGWANSGQLGSIQSKSVEASNVDLAGQLTDMIQANKSYSANSKVFSTSSDMMDVLNNLIR